jgi:hypothetical protein
MEKYTKQMVLFKDIFGKRVEVDFNGGEITSDAGILFLRETEERIGILNRIANVIHDKRHSSYVDHEILTLLKQRVFQIVSGYEDGNDSNELRNDSIMKISCEKLPVTGPSLASQPTMSRFENIPSRTTLYRIAREFVDSFIDSYETPPEGIIIDIDDTDDPTHGSQQLALFNGYHNTYCYMPIHIYEGKSGRLITTILRPGKRPNGKEIITILKRLVKRIRAAWPDTGIILRGDSHYNSPEVHDFCNEYGINLALGQTANNILNNKAHAIIERARECYESRKKPVKFYDEFEYKAASWTAPMRVIVKAEHNEKGANTRFIVTNLKHSNRGFIYKTVYCGRGVMELYIKEHKNHLASDRTSCSSFAANQFRLFLHSAAYVLLYAFRSKYLKGTELATAQFDTIRLKLIKIGARIRELKTRVKIHLPSSFPLKELFFQIWRSCCEPGYT